MDSPPLGESPQRMSAPRDQALGIAHIVPEVIVIMRFEVNHRWWAISMSIERGIAAMGAGRRVRRPQRHAKCGGRCLWVPQKRSRLQTQINLARAVRVMMAPMMSSISMESDLVDGRFFKAPAGSLSKNRARRWIFLSLQ